MCTGGLDGWVDPGQYGIFYALDPDRYDVNGQRDYISALHWPHLQIIIRTAHITLNLGITVLVVMLDPLEVVAYSLLTSTPVVPVSQMFI